MAVNKRNSTPLWMEICDKHNIHVHSIVTHFAQAWDDPEFTNEQLESFLTYAKKYREKGIKLHAANSAGTLFCFGTDLDFVSPGIAMYGLPPDTTEDALQLYTELGLKPILTWMAKPNHTKVSKEGRRVGYDQTYKYSCPSYWTSVHGRHYCQYTGR